MNYTTIEQSKHLLELGLKAETADLFYDIYINPITKEKEGETIDFVCNWKSAWGDKKNVAELFDEKTIPAWSLDALLGLVPHTGYDGITLNNYSDKKVAWTAMFNWKTESTPIRIGYTPLEAVYDMICWMLKNGYIKKKED